MMKQLIQSTFFVFFCLMSFGLQAQLFEDFEEGRKNFYATASDNLESGSWTFDDALVGVLEGDRKNGSRSARIRNGHIQMDFNHPDGAGEVSFYAANFGTDTGGGIQVSYSVNNGASWIAVGDPISLTSELTQYYVSVNVEGNVRLRFAKSSGNRLNVDDVSISNYVAVTDEPTLLFYVQENVYEHQGVLDMGPNTGQSTLDIQLRNGGAEDLVISSYQLTGEDFSIEGDVTGTLSSLESRSLVLKFQADNPGEYQALLTIHSNDPKQEAFEISILAEALDTSKPMPIADARALPQGTLVTVAGWVTVTDQFAGPVYFQDETGGIAWYNGDIMRTAWDVDVIIGDSIVVTGILGNFNNLLQIVDDSGYSVYPESNLIQEPLHITLEQLNTGAYEGVLVRVVDLEFTGTGIFSGGTNYTVEDPSGEGQLRVDNFTNIPGSIIPNSLAAATGVAGRFLNTHQILPRFVRDIQVLSGPIIISTPPYETNATSNSLTFEWVTELPGHSEIRFGETDGFELGKIIQEGDRTSHSITITDLDPATVYKVQLRSALETDTSATAIHIVSTSSPAGATGELMVFFNKDVAHELAIYNEANEYVNFADKLIEHIEGAEETADFAFYNISGTMGSKVADAIIEAHQRGVDVRVMASGHTGSTNTLISRMASEGVRAVYSRGEEQMHNKFAVIDAHHSDPSRSYLVTSSWNATDQGTVDQLQNMVIIQDVALTRAYWLEFNQMWGADSGPYAPLNAAFGADKTVVNPSVFWLGEDQTMVEVYFSPQANTEAQINRTLTTAEASIDVNLNLITRRPISNTMLSRLNQGVTVRGVIGVIELDGSEWAYLNSWADVHYFPQSQFGLLHHKYALVDAEQPGDNSKVITGSHNWSANANFRNDENTLIIHSPRVANEYFQEFAARYWQAGGQDEFDVPVSVSPSPYVADGAGLSLDNYPNPFSFSTTIRFDLPSRQQVTLHVFDIMGRKVATLVEGQMLDRGVHERVFEAGNLENGLYYYSLQLGDGSRATGVLSVVK